MVAPDPSFHSDLSLLPVLRLKKTFNFVSSLMEMVVAGNISANRLALPATYYIIISILVVLSFPTSLASTEILSFSFPNPDGSWATESLRLAGNASVSTQRGIDLNANLSDTYGRATYYQPLHLWDPATGHVADFTSDFSFVIQGTLGVEYADGMTFFLTPNSSGTAIPPGSHGGYFTLANEYGSYPPFIAVEFDTYYNQNPWDPRYEHVGIDINTIQSNATVRWDWYNFTSGGKVNASVMYNSTQQFLSVKLTDANDAGSFSTVNLSINLKDYLPEWVSFGFSSGTGYRFETHTIRSWNFKSNLEISSAPPTKKKNNYWKWIIIAVGSFLLLCFGLGFIWTRHQSKRHGGNPSEDEYTIEPINQELAKVTGPKMFSFREVTAATNDFSNDRLLGEGGFGRVYKGYLKEGNSEVAIKKITPDSRQGIKEYATEVNTISQLRHRNLVQLVGWCHQKKELLLIYEFMPNGSLDTHLFNEKGLLTWEIRHKIAQGLASALLYLHEEWEQCVLHRDIKASNIMLDSDFNAKLGDFGLARLVDHAKGSQTTVLAGTIGYMAPECAYTGKVSKESDIYSFGVVILEIACGRKVSDMIDGRIRLVDWVWELYGIKKLLDAIDPKLGGEYDRRQMQCLIVVGLWCAHPDYKRRPTIREALTVLKFEALPPILPPTPPVPTYSKPQEYGPSPSPHSSYEITSSSNGGGHTTTGSSVPSSASSVVTSSLSPSALLTKTE